MDSVSIKPLDTKITKHIDKMINKLEHFKVVLLPIQGQDDFIFEGDYRVVSVHRDGWEKFSACDFELEDIRLYFERSLKADLETLSQEALNYSTRQHRQQIEEIVNEIVESKIVSQFGVEVRIDNFMKVQKESRIEAARVAEEERKAGIHVQSKRIKTSQYKEVKQLDAMERESDARLKELVALQEKRKETITETDEAAEEEHDILEKRIEARSGNAELPKLPEPSGDRPRAEQTQLPAPNVIEELQAFRQPKGSQPPEAENDDVDDDDKQV